MKIMRKNTSKAIGAVLIAGIVASGLNGMPLNNSVNQINLFPNYHFCLKYNNHTLML